MTTVAIYGVGSMGGAILQGLADGAGPEVLAVVRREEQARALDARAGVRAVALAEAAATAQIHLVTVKPYDVLAMLDAMTPHLREGSVVVSLALGLDLDTLAAHLPEGAAIIRGMPNTPAQVGEGMTVLSPSSTVTAQQLAAVEEALVATGQTLVLPEEQQDAATALSGSAPAYLYLVAEAMVDAGVAQGVPRDTATRLAAQAILGAGAMLRETGEHPAVLRAQVTSPGGSTAAALAQLEAHGVRHAVAEAMRACRDRSAGA